MTHFHGYQSGIDNSILRTNDCTCCLACSTIFQSQWQCSFLESNNTAKQEGFLANEPCPFPVSTNIYICSSLKLTFLKYRTRTGFSKKKKKILVSGFDLIATINKVKKKVLIK